MREQSDELGVERVVVSNSVCRVGEERQGASSGDSEEVEEIMVSRYLVPS